MDTIVSILHRFLIIHCDANTRGTLPAPIMGVGSVPITIESIFLIFLLRF